MDALDAILADFPEDEQLSPVVIDSCSIPLPAEHVERLQALCVPGPDEIQRMAVADAFHARLSADVVNLLLRTGDLAASQISAIGSHGQTIRHSPHPPHPFSLQIGNPALIAELTGITTVADFRRRDIAAGGQGAPLVPAFHSAMFRDALTNRVVVNIGGIANITTLPADPVIPIVGFDTGPGNVLMDGWIKCSLGKQYDANGQWASVGAINTSLLDAMSIEPYFSRLAPKSTGRELFNMQWLAQILGPDLHCSDADVQATLCELTALTIARAVSQAMPDCDELLVCGGGCRNGYLMSRLQAHLPGSRVTTTSRLGIDPGHVEAMAFAWLARQALLGRPANLPSVTGASHPVTLGAIYPA